MKKIITICLLIVTLIVGGTTMDGKATKKKNKTKTSQTVSSQWNGDIPPASTMYGFFQNRNSYSAFKNHGYSYSGDDLEGSLVKAGVCSIEWTICGSHACSIQIYVYDSSKRQWLYNNLKKYISSKKIKRTYVDLDDNCIQIEEVYR